MPICHTRDEYDRYVRTPTSRASLPGYNCVVLVAPSGSAIMKSQSLPNPNSHHMTLPSERPTADDAFFCGEDAFCCGESDNPVDFVSRIRCFRLDLLQID